MNNNDYFKFGFNSSVEEILAMYENLKNEAEAVREKDKVTIKGLFGDFYNKHLNVGVGFKRAYGAMLSGDYFELFTMPRNTYLFVFADISGHGLPAYTTLVRLRSAITLSIKKYEYIASKNDDWTQEKFLNDLVLKFTDIMDASNSNDFASIIFTFIRNEGDKFYLRFFNRGMFFPFIIRKYQNKLIDLYDLNIKQNDWIPKKGHLLGSEIREILEDKYYKFPCCEFTIYEGDLILFFSDGVTEAQNKNNQSDEYGTERLKNLYPQAIVNNIFYEVYEFMGDYRKQNDDMTAVMFGFPPVRDN